MWPPSYIKGFIASRAVIQPFSRTTILIDADAAWYCFLGCVVRKYDGEVTDFSDYGVALIAAALPIPMRMDVHISHNHQFFVTAPLPYLPKLSAVKFHNSVSKTIRVNIIIKKELVDPTCTTNYLPEQKCTTLTIAAGSSMQFVNPRFPDLMSANQFRRPADRCP
jgi:hypothetical protein